MSLICDYCLEEQTTSTFHSSQALTKHKKLFHKSRLSEQSPPPTQMSKRAITILEEPAPRPPSPAAVAKKRKEGLVNTVLAQI